MAEQVRPCPFCGSDIDEIDIKDQCRHYQLLRPCLAMMDEWNTRPIEDKQAELIRLLGDTLDDLRENKTSLMLIWGDKRMKAIYAYRQWKEDRK